MAKKGFILEQVINKLRESELLLNQKATEKSIRKLVEQLSELNPALVLLEESGGLEAPVVAALAIANLLVMVVRRKYRSDLKLWSCSFVFGLHRGQGLRSWSLF